MTKLEFIPEGEWWNTGYRPDWLIPYRMEPRGMVAGWLVARTLRELGQAWRDGLVVGGLVFTPLSPLRLDGIHRLAWRYHHRHLEIGLRYCDPDGTWEVYHDHYPSVAELERFGTPIEALARYRLDREREVAGELLDLLAERARLRLLP